MFNEKDQLAVDTLRALSIDTIEKANSGHPGLPMGAAPMAYTLWTRHLNFNPQSKDYFNRDRSYYLQGMVQHYCIACYMFLVV